jgi:hypothetical protein
MASAPVMTPSRADGQRAGHEPDLLQDLLEHLAPLAFLREKEPAGHPAVVQEQFRRHRSAHAHLRNVPSDRQSRSVPRHEERRDIVLRGLGEHREEIRDRRGRDPGLLTRDDPLVSVPLRTRRYRREIASRTRLGEADGPHPLAGERGTQELVPDHLVAGTVEKVGAHQRLHRAGSRDGQRAAGQFLDRQAVADEVLSAASDPFGIAHPEEAQLSDGTERFPRKHGGLVDLARPRRDLVVHEPLEGFLDRALFLGE